MAHRVLLSALALSHVIIVGALEVLPNDALKKHTSDSNSHHSAMLDALVAKMESRVRPERVGGGPIPVECDLYIINFGAISEFDMDFTVDLYVRQQWLDLRLVFTGSSHPIILNAKLLDKVWRPDLYFPYEKRASYHNIPIPNQRMLIFPNGTVMYSYRITLTTACPMELSRFPMDKQVCKLILQSFTYEDHDVVLRWTRNPISLPKNIDLPRFELTYMRSKSCHEHHYRKGDYSCLRTTFHIKRQYGYYILQTYVPTMMIVMLSWVAFWINKESEPARVGMGVGTVLTMATQLASTKNSMPRISYPKAIDVWLTCCMFFVYAATLEYAFVNTFSRLEKAALKQNERDDTVENAVLLKDYRRYDSDRVSSSKSGIREHSKYETIPLKAGRVTSWTKAQCRRVAQVPGTAESIDDYSRFMFPLIYLCFNVVYWTYYLRH